MIERSAQRALKTKGNEIKLISAFNCYWFCKLYLYAGASLISVWVRRKSFSLKLS